VSFVDAARPIESAFTHLWKKTFSLFISGVTDDTFLLKYDGSMKWSILVLKLKVPGFEYQGAFMN